MDYVIIGLLVVLIILVVISLSKNINESNITERLGKLEVSMTKEMGDFKVDINKNLNEDFTKLNEQVEKRLNEGLRESSNKEIIADLKKKKKKEQELLSDIINLLKEKLYNDKTKDSYNTYIYLYHFIQSMDTNPELKYILAYMSKSLGFTDPMEFNYNKDKQFVFESILFSAMTLYSNGGASKNKLGDSHKRFIENIEAKKEEKLSRTQELNTVKIQALKELGYTEINEDNAKEIFEKIAEIQSRKV